MNFTKKILLILLISVTRLFAQDTTSIKLATSQRRINDSTFEIKLTAKIPTNWQLFSIEKPSVDALFSSNIEFDSTTKSNISSVKVTERGKSTLIKESDNISYKIYAESVEYIITVVGKNLSNKFISGSLNWLAKHAGDYPSNSSTFMLQINEPDNLQQSNTIQNTSPKSLGYTFFICFLSGLLAIITPCVFPLIPVTVSFFLKRSSTKSLGIRNAVTYSLSIIAIYTFPTLLLTLLFGDGALYAIATSATFNLLFFIIFLIFAISFFGAFEITLPNSWANKADEKAGKGGLTGIFFMALTLVIVSFSCTGPIVGTLLGQTSSQGISLAPVIGMFGFGVGLALPFSLFAFFPSMLQSLPKSGGWLNTVKVTFGFIELGLAFKFLSNVDLIYHKHWLDRDVFLAIWIVLSFMAGLYLLGKFKLAHDPDTKSVSIPRLLFAMLFLMFGTYMIPGLWGAPLKLLSGFIPPATTQEFNLDNIQYLQSNKPGSNATIISPKKYTDKLKVPFGITAYFDLEEGMAAAKQLNKPVMLDFTGHSCANCRKMEEEVWKNNEVLQSIKNDFVLISLYVDEKTLLDAKEQYVNKEKQLITTLGEKNLDFEKTKFGINSQPLYMFLSPEGKILSDKLYGYDPNVAAFLQHLNSVKNTFHQQ